MSGMTDLNNMIHLQVVGQNKLSKEIRELKDVRLKVYDRLAIHRNETTRSQEPQDGYQNLVNGGV